MKFSESWLRSLVDPPISSAELSHLLTMAGLEVEDESAFCPSFDKVVVAQVLAMEKHPDADRLNVLKVDVGQGELLTIVCGAQNVAIGMKAPCALVGARLPSSDIGKSLEIKQAKVRGVMSFGMMCSAKELGLEEESSGLMVLAEDAPIGLDLRTYLDLDDNLITLKLTPNRSDCLSIFGIAREVAALTSSSIKPIPNPSIEQNHEQSCKVKVTEPTACPRYTGRVITGLDAQSKTPLWMVRRLERCGLRSISALVDVTNYVLLELGQPLHAFDLDKLNGDIEIRFAREAENLELLNEQKISLQPDMLVISDNHGPIALAGIMGGAESCVDSSTTNVFLESAFFSPGVIAGKSRRIGVSSDSSYRFERGVDFAGTQFALDRATNLILEICGGKAGSMIEIAGELPSRPPVKLRSSRVQRVLGLTVDPEKIGQILSRLGMEHQYIDGVFSVTPPSYRFDITIEEDLIEEVARIYGYQNINPLPSYVSLSMLPQAEAKRSLSRLRQIMICRDYYETINYAFVEPELEKNLCGNNAPIHLKNPISSQMSIMRSSLLPGLLNTLQTNLSRKQSRVRIFEIGGCFAYKQGTYMQNERIAGLAYGEALPEQWGEVSRNVDFYDLKSEVEALSFPLRFDYVAGLHPAMHPGRSSRIILEGNTIGWIGELHPKWQLQYNFPLSVAFFEIDLVALERGAIPQVSEISHFPRVRRDLAVIVDEETKVHNLVQSMLDEKVSNVIEITLFDIYRGKGVDKGKKSLAFRVLLQDTQKTLTDNEIDQSVSSLLKVLERQGARLRM